jgi:hypothetical protein
LAALPSQLSKPALHAPIPQVLAAHVATAFGGVGPALRHAPQWATVFVVFTSQPVIAFASQSAKPALHAPGEHAPRLHRGVMLAPAGQAFPHAPQLATLVLRSSQTVLPPLVQSMFGSAQSTRHVPATHICPPGHALLQRPQ